ncbi:hypothetical protein N9064_00045 [bacterium]|nr:hypothetical protein [bacterium]
MSLSKNGSAYKEAPSAFDWFWNLIGQTGGGTTPDEMCSFCDITGERRITKEQPEEYEEVTVVRQEFNRDTRKFEKVTKNVMRLKEFPDEPHPTEIVENMQYQYQSEGFVNEKQMPFCTNVIDGIERPHYAHYSCIRDLIIQEDAVANVALCPECRSKVQEKIVVLVRNTPGYAKKLQIIKEKNEKLKKFQDIIYRRELSYYYQNGSMLLQNEMNKMIYDENNARKKMQPMEKHLYQLAIQTYTDRFFEISENEEGLTIYEDMKKNFFKHIPLSYTDEMFDIEHADMASIVIMGTADFVDRKMEKYLNDKKPELMSMPPEVMRGVVQYFLMTYLAAHIWTVLQEGFEATKKYVNMGMDHRKAIVWVFMLDPRPILFGDFEIVKLLYNDVIGADASSPYKDSVPIPLYGLSDDHINWLYLMGFSFQRFVVSKKHGKKIGDYKVSIPRLLFWKQRDYDTPIKTISNYIINGAGSGIDNAVANAIATISYNNRDEGGSVRFEIGPYNGMDMTPKQWAIRLGEEEAITRRAERRQEENERQIIQEIEGLSISELLFGQSSSNLNNPQQLFDLLSNAVYALDMDAYNRYKKYALENGVLLHVSIQQPNRNPWLKAIKTAGAKYKLFYYVVFIDIVMNVMITGGSKKVTTAEQSYCANALVNKVLGYFAADCDLNDYKNLMRALKFRNYLYFAEQNADNMVINNVKYVKYLYEKVEEYAYSISYLPADDLDRYQRSLNTISTRENDIGENVPLVALYINDMILKSYVEEDDEPVRTFLKLIQLILEYCFSGKGIRKIKPFIKNNKELLEDLMPQLNIEVFADIIIKHQGLDKLQRLAMTYDIREAVKNKNK